MGDARGKLAERGEFLRLDQSILRAAQIVDGLGELFGARLDLIEKPSVFDRDHSLVGESPQDFDFPRRVLAGFGARQHEGALYLRLAEQRHSRRARPGLPWAASGTA